LLRCQRKSTHLKAIAAAVLAFDLPRDDGARPPEGGEVRLRALDRLIDPPRRIGRDQPAGAGPE